MVSTMVSWVVSWVLSIHSMGCLGVFARKPHQKSAQMETGPIGPWGFLVVPSSQVKVSLARALIMNPDLLVLHRPFHHFDLATADDVLAVPRDDGHLGEGPRFSPRLCPQKVVRFPSRKNLPKMAPVLCVCVFFGPVHCSKRVAGLSITTKQLIANEQTVPCTSR